MTQVYKDAWIGIISGSVGGLEMCTCGCIHAHVHVAYLSNVVTHIFSTRNTGGVGLAACYPFDTIKASVLACMHTTCMYV